ncbi:MAG: ATP-dependent DNA ligase, partial [Actinobacteria bacterium]|nr:ATP-dependent DNA ligase [Actinomycetota bacterium]
MLLADLAAVSQAVASTRSRSEKIELLAATLGRLSPDEAPIAVSYLSGKPTQSRLGVGYATVYGVKADPASDPSLEILDVDEILESIAATSGPGSKQRRESDLSDLLAQATPAEQEFLRGLILRNLRQGALEGVMADAVAVALGVPADRVRRAAMLEGDLVAVASRALADGSAALGLARLALFTPVQPMLARTATTAGEAVTAVGTAIVEWKLDGARIQVHKDGDRVGVFTRNLRDITARVPEVVDAARRFEAGSLIVDGEVLLLGPTGSPQEFQDSMSRFGSGEASGGAPLTAFYFD